VSHFFAAPQGQLTWDGCLSDDGSQGCGDIPGDPFNHPRDVVVGPDGTSVYVASYDSGTISHFFAAAAGQLTWDGCVSDDGSGGFCADIPGTGSPLAGANGVAVSADGASVYVTSFGPGTVSHLFAAPHGQLTWDGCVSDDGSGGSCADVPGSTTPLAGASEVAVSPDGSSAYVSAVSSGAIVAFTTPSTGQLTYQGCVASAGGNGCSDVPGGVLVDPYGLAVSPDGKSLYASATESASVTHFVRATASTSGGGTGGAGGSTGGGGGTNGGGSTNGGVGDSKTIPVLTSLSIQPSAFSAAPGGATVITSSTSRKGGLITYQLNVAATVHFVVERSLPGRRQRVNGKLRCEVPTHRNAQAAECVRVVSVGNFTQAGNAGANSLRFSGRLDGKKLPHATYTLIATPKTAIAGHAVSKTFKIKG
jgi:DNA-binding beta-propeller fold protein YncE